MEATCIAGKARGAGGAAELDTAVVLGARNLGGAITRDLLARRVRVATIARTRTDLDALEHEGAVPIQADATDPDQLREALFERRQGSDRPT